MGDNEKLQVIRDPLILCGAFLVAMVVAPRAWMMILFGVGALVMAACAQMGWRITSG